MSAWVKLYKQKYPRKAISQQYSRTQKSKLYEKSLTSVLKILRHGSSIVGTVRPKLYPCAYYVFVDCKSWLLRVIVHKHKTFPRNNKSFVDIKINLLVGVKCFKVISMYKQNTTISRLIVMACCRKYNIANRTCTQDLMWP